MAMPDQFTEIAWIAISDDSGNQYQFGAITDTIEINFGARDIESIATLSAGRVTKFIPEELTEINLELFPVGISSNATTPNGIHGWFLGLTPDATSGIVQFKRRKFRVTALWTDLYGDDAPEDAAGGLASGDHVRFSFWNCYMTDAKLDFTDDILKASVTFKCPPYNRAGSGMIKVEEADGAALDSLGSYTGAAPN